MSETKPEAKQPQPAMSQDAINAMIASAVTAAVEAVNKPKPLSDQEQARIAQENQVRASTAEGVLEQIKAKRFEQLSCTHRHATGESHCVYLVDGNYILCQKCQGKIRPEDGKNTDRNSIYDTALFNRLFQEMNKTDM